MEVWSRLPERNPGVRVLVAVPNSDPAMESWCTSYQGRVRVVIDPGGAAARRFNARWMPRAYLLDERQRLAYVQPVQTPDARAPAEVQSLWSGKR